MTSPVDPEAMTGYQRVLLEGWPAEGIEPFCRFAGPVDRAEAVEAGAVTDPVLLDLLEKLGTSCPDVDTAARHVSRAADAVGAAFDSRMRDPGDAEGYAKAVDEVRRIFGPLRNIAVAIWRLDGSEWRANPMYRPPVLPR